MNEDTARARAEKNRGKIGRAITWVKLNVLTRESSRDIKKKKKAMRRSPILFFVNKMGNEQRVHRHGTRTRIRNRRAMIKASRRRNRR